ncbi:hypothetical protein [Pseudobacillus badius]|uniref:hypothetical protein n=1 Tax=Bacillus badius TaxID=1455 RepID=UPI0024A419A9|nr:hypothetical protein [Bacillus badius]GLY11391.1 hypothetical protein Bbad01_26070 [Bacillus badius]
MIEFVLSFAATLGTGAFMFSMGKKHQQLNTQEHQQKKREFNYKEEMDFISANRLYKCDSCGKYSRRHQQIVHILRRLLREEQPLPEQRFYIDDSLDFRLGHECPHCSVNMRHTFSSDDKYSWLDTHPDCFKLDEEDYFKYKQTVDNTIAAINEIESMKAYQEYNGFTMNDEGRLEHSGFTERTTPIMTADIYVYGAWMKRTKQFSVTSYYNGAIEFIDGETGRGYVIESVQKERKGSEFSYLLGCESRRIIIHSSRELGNLESRADGRIVVNLKK